MVDNTLPRIGGIVLILGAIFVAIGAALHPNPVPWGTPGTRQFFINFINAINGFDLWTLVHSIVIAFYVLLTFGVGALYKSFRDRGEEIFSILALLAAILGASVNIVTLTIDGFAFPMIARAYASAGSEVSKEAALNIFQSLASANIPVDVIIGPLLQWSAFGFIGVAVIRTRLFPRWVGYLGLALGIAMWLDWPAATIVIPSQPFPFILAAVTGQLFVTVLWLLAVGAYMLRLR